MAFLKKPAQPETKSIKKLMNQVVQAVDQNDDGRLNLKDVTAVAGTVGSAVKKGAVALKENAAEKARLNELKELRPIFADYFEHINYISRKFLRVVERSEKYMNSEACQGAIGYLTTVKEKSVIHVFQDSLLDLGFRFYPNPMQEAYCLDPADTEHYIALDSYFEYVKKARISELVQIANDLGVKHYRVTFCEKQQSAEKRSFAASMTSKAKGVTANAESSAEKSEHMTINGKIESEGYFPGSEPTEPKLQYLENEPEIKNLISMRMSKRNPTNKERYDLSMGHSCGISVTEAAAVSAAMGKNKSKAAANFELNAEKEQNKKLVFEVEF